MPEENGSKKKLIMIVAAALITLLIIAAAVFFIFFSGDAEEDDDVNKKSSYAAENFNAANYVPLPAPLVFNVMEGKRERTVQIKVQLMVSNAQNEALARKHMPLLESTLLRVFGAASAEQLRTPEGKSELRKTALVELNEATIRLEGYALVHSVLFTGFVLQ